MYFKIIDQKIKKGKFYKKLVIKKLNSYINRYKLYSY